MYFFSAFYSVDKRMHFNNSSTRKGVCFITMSDANKCSEFVV